MRAASLALSLLFLVTAGRAAFGAARVAVQPFGRTATEPLRKQVARIIGQHGYRVLTNLPAVEGTSQYPGIAKDKHLRAFVVADVTDRGKRVLLSFLVWQGRDGSVVGRWEVGVDKKKVGQCLAKEFWKRLGPAIRKARGPFANDLPPAPTMRINAGTPIADSERMAP